MLFCNFGTSVPELLTNKDINFIVEHSSAYWQIVFQRQCRLRLLSESAAAFPMVSIEQYLRKLGL
jgi:hypothetical protein